MLTKDAPARDRTLTQAPIVDDALRALVVRLGTELAALGARVAVLERQVRVRVDDDAALMRAIVGSVGACVFTAAELREHATVDHALQAVLRPFRTARHVGKRLRAIADQPLAGFVLRRVGRDHSGTIWGVQASIDLHAGPWPGGEPGA